LLSSQPLTASADLSQNTLSHFLDRFVYKNPKKAKAGEAVGKGASAMQPAASAVEGVKLAKGEVGAAVMVNDPRFLKKKTSDVPVDQVCWFGLHVGVCADFLVAAVLPSVFYQEGREREG
jgi:ribosome biogenesis protein MAK21